MIRPDKKGKMMVSIARMKSLILSATAMALVAPGGVALAQAPAATAPSTEAALAGLDAYVEQARKTWDVPGVSVVIVKDDKIVYAKGFGVREVGKPGKVDADTIYAIGSASKAFTAAALGILVDEKKIAWDGKVHDYMPAFELADPWVTRQVTVRDLLAHRSGVQSNGLLWVGSGADRNEVIRRLRFQTASLGFRNNFHYQNEMYMVAGEVVPAVSGIGYDKFLASRIFAPLGMRRTNTSVTDLKGLANVATPHVPIDGRMTAIDYHLIDNIGGAGVINSSGRDMAQWVRMQLGGGSFEGKQLIAPATLAEMHTGQIVSGSGGGSFKFTEYGLGWGLQEYRGQKIVHHTGGIDGMHSLVGMIPDRKLGVIVLTNTYPNRVTSAIELRVFDAFMDGARTDHIAVLKARDDAMKAAQEKATPPRPATIAPPTLPLDRYAGTYSSDMVGEVKVALVDGALVLSRPTASAALVHDNKDQFKAKWKSPGLLSIVGETPAGFTFGPDGQISGLELGTDKLVRK
jgi:CubicO group peptidase (beta-lactamase class C family)